MKRIIAQTRKELTQTFRDRTTLTQALALPLAQMWLIGAAISPSVTDLRVVVRDMDQTPHSRRYAEALRGSLSFRVVSLPEDYPTGLRVEQLGVRAPAGEDPCVPRHRRGVGADARARRPALRAVVQGRPDAVPRQLLPLLQR